MSDLNARITMMPITQWPEDRLRKAWRLVCITVARLHQAPLSMPDRAALLADAEADAALFGEELLRRGLI
jgi:hypothetical protein